MEWFGTEVKKHINDKCTKGAPLYYIASLEKQRIYGVP